MKLKDGKWWSVPLAAMRGVSVGRSLEPQGFRQTRRVAVRETIITLMILGWLGLGVPAQFSAGAALAQPAAASSTASFTVDLNYQETDQVQDFRSIVIKPQSSAFRKEPTLAKRDVFRGLLLWGTLPEQATPFIWDKGRGQLYLDLNRNRDLTDDPKGVFASASREDSQTFTNIHLVVPFAAGDRLLRLQVELSSYQARNLRAYVGLCCYWQARVSLDGKEWQFGLMENVPDGKTAISPQHVLLRPWAERQRPLRLNSATPDGFDYTKNLFFGDRAYELDCRYEPGGDSPKYKVTFKEQAPRLGELKVTGTDLHRLILTANPATTVVLDQPEGTVKLPVGNYSLEEIWLRKGEVEVLRPKAGKVTVDDQRATSLVAGGPLTNSVEVKSQGQNLQLNYKLLGADGGAYQLARPDTQHPPEFAVFQGTNRLAGDKFQFG